MRSALLSAWAASMLALTACGPTVGDPCTTASDCGGQLCLNKSSTPGGYCSRECTVGNDSTCPNGSTCVANGAAAGIPACYRTCHVQSDCRSGYGCTTLNNNPLAVCVAP